MLIEAVQMAYGAAPMLIEAVPMAYGAVPMLVGGDPTLVRPRPKPGGF